MYCRNSDTVCYVQEYKVPHRTGHINIDIARRLTAAYGDQAFHVTHIAQHEQLSRRLVPWHDIIEAEVCEFCLLGSIWVATPALGKAVAMHQARQP